MSIKSLNGLAFASIKSRNGLAVASIKSVNALVVPSSGIGNVTSGDRTPNIYYEAVRGYQASGQSHNWKVSAYKGTPRVYSDVPYEIGIYTDAGDFDPDDGYPIYTISLSWGAVDGADGYRVIKYYDDNDAYGLPTWNYSHYKDIASNSLLDDFYDIWTPL